MFADASGAFSSGGVDDQDGVAFKKKPPDAGRYAFHKIILDTPRVCSWKLMHEETRVVPLL
jgi:hypothetical protein